MGMQQPRLRQPPMGTQPRHGHGHAAAKAKAAPHRHAAKARACSSQGMGMRQPRPRQPPMSTQPRHGHAAAKAKAAPHGHTTKGRACSSQGMVMQQSRHGHATAKAKAAPHGHAADKAWACSSRGVGMWQPRPRQPPMGMQPRQGHALAKAWPCGSQGQGSPPWARSSQGMGSLHILVGLLRGEEVFTDAQRRPLLSLATGRHAHDKPLGTQPRIFHGARWALNASPGWTQVGISRACGLVVLSFRPSNANSAPLDASLYTVGLAVCHSGVHLAMLRFNVRDSVSLCYIPALKALVPLVDSFPVDAPHRASAGPRSRPCVPHVPYGLRVIDVDHVGVLVASDAEHHVGLGPPAPFANVPSERYRSTPQDFVLVHAFPCPRASQGLWAASTSTRNAT
nr:hypothetical protein CFP56_74726 [Quercus suber]